MKLLSYRKEGQDQLAMLVEGSYYDMDALHPELPGNMEFFLNIWPEVIEMARHGEHAIQTSPFPVFHPIHPDTVELLAPVPHPASFRDAYAFRQHVETARRNRGLPMIPEFDQFPVFYFSNPHSIQGPGDIFCMPDHFLQLDFELEVAVVIAKTGRNIPAEGADEYIAGFLILNDMSARGLQSQEMKLNLGPAKGKDFCSVIGPLLVTPDELQPFLVPTPAGHVGKQYGMKMEARVNGQILSSGSMADMHWTFAEIIERCSYGVTLQPGDIIGSGTVGTGCLLELNGTKKLQHSNDAEQWLKPGDLLEMEVEGLGILTSTIREEDSDFSLMAQQESRNPLSEASTPPPDEPYLP
ncbi:MAG: fumarylacetoacetate hydrolase family protein [Chitinophagaceae bacterium]